MSQPHVPTCPLNPPHVQPCVPKCYPKGLIPPCCSPKPTRCPSPMSPSVTLKVSFHYAGCSSLNHQHLDWWFCWSYLCGSKWCFLVLSDPVVLSDPNPLVLSDPPTGQTTWFFRFKPYFSPRKKLGKPSKCMLLCCFLVDTWKNMEE